MAGDQHEAIPERLLGVADVEAHGSGQRDADELADPGQAVARILDEVRPEPALVPAVAVLEGCASKPLMPYTTDTPPLVLVPAALAGVQDKRARFREIYCAVLEARRSEVPDYRPCDEALTRVGTEPAGTGKRVDLAPSRRGLIAAVVPGIGYECFEQWLEPSGSVARHVRAYGYDQVVIKVDGLSSARNNARQIRDGFEAAWQRS